MLVMVVAALLVSAVGTALKVQGALGLGRSRWDVMWSAVCLPMAPASLPGLAPGAAGQGSPARHPGGRRANVRRPRPGLAGCLALSLLVLVGLAAPAIAQTAPRTVPLLQTIGAALFTVRDAYVDLVQYGPLLAGGLAGAEPFAPDASSRAAVADAMPALRRGGEERPMIELFATAFQQVVRNRDVSATDPLLTAVIRGIVTAVDPQGGYTPPTPPQAAAVDVSQPGGIGLELALLDNEPTVLRALPGSPAERAGLRPGDVVLDLDGQRTAGLALGGVVALMRGPYEGRLLVTVRRDGAERSYAMGRRPVPPLGPEWAVLGRVLYVRAGPFGEKNTNYLRGGLERMREVMGASLDGLVLDLRENGGGLLNEAAAVAGLFLPAGEPVATLSGRLPEDNRTVAATGDITAGLPIAVLVNEATASGAEIVAASLQDHRRAVLLGRQTSGSGTVRTYIPFEATGGVLQVSTARLSRPSGQPISAGVAPDVVLDLPTGSVAARLRAWRATTLPARAAASPPERPDLGHLAGRIAAAPPAATLDPDGPETDWEVRQALQAIALLRGGASPP